MLREARVGRRAKAAAIEPDGRSPRRRGRRAGAPSGTTLPCAALVLAVGVRGVDALGLLVLLAFTWWGARKGALRQALSLAVLGGAFLVAGRAWPAVQPTVAKLFVLGPDAQQAAAWAGVLFGALVLGALLVRLLGVHLPEHGRGDLDRVLGGLLGALKGAVVLTVVGTVLLAAGAAGPAPLSRTSGVGAPAQEGAGLEARVRGSLSAVCLEEWGSLLLRVVRPPAWIEERAGRVERALEQGEAGSAAGARPRGR